MQRIIDLKVTELEANVLLMALDKLKYDKDMECNETTNCICKSVRDLGGNINTAITEYRNENVAKANAHPHLS